MNPAVMAAEQYFWPKVGFLTEGQGCWEWLGAEKGKGYGAFLVGGKVCRAHRYAYELLVGPVPEGLHLDHLCRNRGCVNPNHLDPVTNAENHARARVFDLTGMCASGLHSVTDPESVYTDPRGTRACRACRTRRKRAQSARR